MNFLRIIFFPILLILSFLYYLVLNFLRLKYRNVTKFNNTKIICVGNYTLGGVGKTEFVKKIVQELSKLKKNVVIITKGYKRKSKENILCLLPKNNISLNVENYGDEPTMLFKNLSVPIIIGKRKKELVEYAIKNFNPDVIVSDDGYQNFTFYKDINILVVSSIKNFWDKFLFPLGNLREPVVDSVKRADFIVLNHSNMISLSELEKFKKSIYNIKKEVSIVESCYKIKNFVQYITDEKFSIEEFKKISKDIVVFSGIGFPKSLRFILSSNNFNIKKEFLFRDHYWYKENDLKKVLIYNFPVVTTSKDIVRINKVVKNFSKNLIEKIFFVEIELVILEGKEKWEEMLRNL